MLALGALVRLAVAVAYWPGLYYTDSLIYLRLARGGPIVGLTPDRPSGYALLLKLVSWSGHHIAPMILLQHVAGLVTGVILYALLLRLGVKRWLATAAVAVVVLDGYAIALEQEIMPEALFTLALIGSAYLAMTQRRSAIALVSSGALLGAAATMRTVAIFAIPVWAIYVLWTHRRVRLIAAAAVGVALPLVVYAGFHYARTDRASLSQAEGWFLYARIGQIGDCRGAHIPASGRALCRRTPRDDSEGPAYFMWKDQSPARRVFGGLNPDPHRQERSNQILRRYALAIIRDRPLRYAQMVGADFLRYVTPGVGSRYTSDWAVLLPDHRRAPDRAVRAAPNLRRVYLPATRAPVAVVRAYQSVVHTPRWLLAWLALVALSCAPLSLIRGLVIPRRAEIFLLTGSGLALLLGSVATNDFILRYLLPTVPLLIAGGVAAADGLVFRSRRPHVGDTSTAHALRPTSR